MKMGALWCRVRTRNRNTICVLDILLKARNTICVLYLLVLTSQHINVYLCLCTYRVCVELSSDSTGETIVVVTGVMQPPSVW